ncbi:MAG: decaprenyl-phosphate phosphoribosyltransferase [Acidobacteria bacterium]|jgi:4-hydroxybenzoate polyprenyltransferase|nr:decaprenyl-phosphate phosphoribosyltransferase [Acidobacteriota bacterium]
MARPRPHIDAPGASAPPEAPASLVRSLVVSARPSQWTKNLIVFAGLLFGRQLLHPDAVGQAVGTFVVFCALSSAVYLVNDVMDRDADRIHPKKRHRPIASGALSVQTAVVAAAVVGGLGLAGAWFVGRGVFAIAGSYFVLLSLYSGPIKRLVILDVLTIAIGFVMRAAAGAVAIDVPISNWLLVCTILLALFLALSKRRQELVLLADGATSHRRILEEYSTALLDQMIAVVTASTLMAYALYTVSPETVAKFGTDQLIFTLPFPLYGIFRYLYLVHQKQGGGSPAEMLITDRPLLACVALWAGAVVLIVYGPFRA